jgi:hypothetical protein
MLSILPFHLFGSEKKTSLSSYGTFLNAAVDPLAVQSQRFLVKLR